jgi:hypothetical protein
VYRDTTLIQFFDKLAVVVMYEVNFDTRCPSIQNDGWCFLTIDGLFIGGYNAPIELPGGAGGMWIEDTEKTLLC